jgi:hypothetical protein
MQVKILDVKAEYVKTARGGYNKAQVAYDAGNGVKSHNIMDFANKQVYTAVVAAKPGDYFDVVTRKNDKGYDEWATITSVAPGAATASAAASPASGVSRTTGSNYETKEERAIRQRLIVRQSSLSAAVATLAPGSKTALNPDEVMELAERYNSFVFAEPKLFEQANDLPSDDIPY